MVRHCEVYLRGPRQHVPAHDCENRLQNVFLEVYDKLQRRIGLRSEGVGDRRNELFHRFIHLLRSACTEQREVTWYADRLCVSTRYLASITHAVDRKSPKELIDEFVVLEIKMLLQSTDLTLQEIAARMHFPDQSCMGHYFRRRTACRLWSGAGALRP